MSFGGNDIGFSDVIVDCLVGVPDSWAEFVIGGVASSLTGCDVSEAELRERIDALLDPTERSCTGTRVTGTAGYFCDLNLGGRRGSLIDAYYDVVTHRLTDRGVLVVVGYPRLFAPTSQWPAWSAIACQGVKRGDTEKLGRVAEYFNTKLKEAVQRANQALGSERVAFVDRLELFASGGHELCGSGEDWVNGISATRGAGITFRRQTSFHPNEAGHNATGAAVADHVRLRVDPRTPTPTTSSQNVTPTSCEGVVINFLDPLSDFQPAVCADGWVLVAHDHSPSTFWLTAARYQEAPFAPVSVGTWSFYDGRDAIVDGMVAAGIPRPVAEALYKSVAGDVDGRSSGVEIATCTTAESMYVGMPGPNPEVALVQETLVELGYDPGEVDGYFGENTFRAILEFVSGVLDVTFDDAIFIDEGAILRPVLHQLNVTC